MRYSAILRWLEREVKPMRQSRRKTLAALVASLLAGGKAGVIGIARHMRGTALDKHKIKRVYRFLRNPAVEVDSVAQVLLRWAVGNRPRVMILLDWTDVGPYQQLVAAVPLSGRAIPICALTVGKRGEGIRRTAERAMMRKLASWIPAGVQRVVIADRGFDGGQWMAWLQKQGWDYVIRVRGRVEVNSPRYQGFLEALWRSPARRTLDLGWAWYNENGNVRTRIISCWHPGQKEPWHIATTLEDLHPAQILRLYGHRMWIEETFRDLKNRRWGMSLRGVRLSRPERYQRLFVVLALTYFFAAAAGCLAEKRRHHFHYQSNTQTERKINLFRMGRLYLRKCRDALPRILKAIDAPVF